MLYTICIALILIASVLVILAVLVQNPKSGMAANFGASNQVMGVRETTNFLEKFTWTMAIAIVVLSLVATLAMDKGLVAQSNSEISKDAKALQEQLLDTEAAPAMPQAEIPAEQPAQPPKSPLIRRRREPDTDAGEKQEPEGQMPGPKRTGNGKGQKAPRKRRRAKRKRSGRKRPGTAGNPARYKPKFREE